MASKRYDKQGRELWRHEYQREDGRYEYRYLDARGKRRSVYSYTLKGTDTPPPGCLNEPCLRDLEREIGRDVDDEIDSFTAKRTPLNVFFDKHIVHRVLKDSTRENYKYMYTKYVRYEIGSRPIAEIRYTDIKNFYLHLINDCHFKPASMEIIHTIIHPIFTDAVRDGYIRLNPTDGVMTEIKRRHDWERTKRIALTAEQQEAFVSFVKSSDEFSHWMPIITILLGTGCRIGEALGLTWDNVDFANGVITIDHNLLYRRQEDGKQRHTITTPKSKAGFREIPMFPEVRRMLSVERMRQMREQCTQPVIDGYTNFVFLNRYDMIYNPGCINRAIIRIYTAYNEQEKALALEQGRPPILLPHFSVHNLRHTFCTRLCENTSDDNTLKTIQEIMGHARISTTLDVYTDLTRKKKQDAFAGLEGKFSIG